jgi:hypothetical protein
MNFQEFCSVFEASDNQQVSISNTCVISFNKQGGSGHSIGPSDVVALIRFLRDRHHECYNAWNASPNKKDSFVKYEEKSYREIYKAAKDIDPTLNVIASLALSQTIAVTQIVAKFISYFSGSSYADIKVNTFYDKNSLDVALSKIPVDITTIAFPSLPTDRSQQEKFKSWMRLSGLAERTVISYAVTGIGVADELQANVLANFPGVYSLTKPSEVKALIDSLSVNQKWIEKNSFGNGMYKAALSKYHEFLSDLGHWVTIPKPFILLAGISGTGKTRYVRIQAAKQRPNLSNYLLVPVRPDWHEPSDLLGYVSRISGEKYVPTPFLKFVAEAWRDAAASATVDGFELKQIDAITTYWACLDEMNLAPVEQYFADYLSVLETRRWEGDKYECDSLIHPAELLNGNSEALKALCTELGFSEGDGLWQYFVSKGIPLPPNLVVAGTVNMDETTHGFSRKVIDRAFTFDFGEFFPNNFDKYFEPDTVPKSLVFPRYSHGKDVDLSDVASDPDGAKSIKFLTAVNALLNGTPFELAFRALSELLVSVKCFSPADDLALQAVWDDFLMGKLLPRLEGDAEKLKFDGEESLLTRLIELLKSILKGDELGLRPDLLSTKADESVLSVAFRSPKKLDWMQERLARDSFTSFWP